MRLGALLLSLGILSLATACAKDPTPSESSTTAQIVTPSGSGTTTETPGTLPSPGTTTETPGTLPSPGTTTETPGTLPSPGTTTETPGTLPSPGTTTENPPTPPTPEKTYQISFDCAGGSPCAPLAVKTGASYTLPTPSRTDYVFAGWYAENVKFTDGIWTLTENITLTAKWTYAFVFRKTADGAELCSYLGNEAQVQIPAQWDGMPVCRIAANAFSFRARIERIGIPASVREIADGAFVYCQKLAAFTVDAENPAFLSADGVLYDRAQTVLLRCPGARSAPLVLPQTLTEIRPYAMQNCTKLKEITFPDTLTELGARALDDTAWFANQPAGLLCIGKVCYRYVGSVFDGMGITVPDGIVSVSDHAFEEQAGLGEIGLPDSVRKVGDFAFFNCTGLLTANLSFAKEIGKFAFHGCKNLRNVTFDGEQVSFGNHVFGSCKKLKNFVIPSGVTILPEGMFADCTALTAVTLPAALQTVEADAFARCTALRTLTVPAELSLSTLTVGTGNEAFVKLFPKQED